MSGNKPLGEKGEKSSGEPLPPLESHPVPRPRLPLFTAPLPDLSSLEVDDLLSAWADSISDSKTEDLVRPFEGLQEELPTILTFVMVFSRFEYALKKAGYVRSLPKAGLVVDWDKFAKNIKDRAPHLFTSAGWSQEFQEDVAEILTMPPKKQVLTGGDLEFQAAPAPDCPDFKLLLDMVKRIRNNLFHGGKSPYDPQRDTPLLRAAFAVLTEALRRDPDVKAFYA